MKQEQNKGADPRKKGDRSNKQKKAIGNKVLGIYLAVLLLILGVIGTAMFIVYQSENIGKQVAGIFEGIEEVQPEQESGSAEAEQSEKTHSVKGTGERKVTILSCEVLPCLLYTSPVRTGDYGNRRWAFVPHRCDKECGPSRWTAESPGS